MRTTKTSSWVGNGRAVATAAVLVTFLLFAAERAHGQQAAPGSAANENASDVGALGSMMTTRDATDAHSDRLTIDLPKECAGGVCRVPTDLAPGSVAKQDSTSAFADTTPVSDPLRQAITPPITSTAISSGTFWRRVTHEPIAAAALSLAIVVGGYFLLRVCLRNRSGTSGGRIPAQVIEVVGYAPLGPRQQLQLLRLGNRLVLVAVNSNHAETLAEITDPTEVDQIIEACRSGTHSLTHALDRLSRRGSLNIERTAAPRPRRSARAVFEA